MIEHQQKQETAGLENRQARPSDMGATDLSGRVWWLGQMQALEGSLGRHWLGVGEGIWLGGDEAEG